MDLIYNKPDEPRLYLASDAEYAMTDEELNAALDARPGTLVAKAGYTAMKQKGLDGAWTAL